MTPHCSPRHPAPVTDSDQRMAVVLDVAADRRAMEAAAAQVLMFLLDELRTEGIAVRRVSIELAS